MCSRRRAGHGGGVIDVAGASEASCVVVGAVVGEGGNAAASNEATVLGVTSKAK